MWHSPPGSPAQPHDGTFIKNNTCKTINTDIQIENRMSYLMLGVQVQMNLTPLASTQALIEIQILHS